MLAVSAFGVVLMAATILGEFGLTPLGKLTLRILGMGAIAVGLAFA